MPRLAYRRVYSVNEVEAGELLIETYEETGNLSETAREWQTWRYVVRKWARRYEAEGEAGLRDHSRSILPPRRRTLLNSPPVVRSSKGPFCRNSQIGV